MSTTPEPNAEVPVRRQAVRNRGASAVWLLTIGWFLSLGVLAWYWFGLGMEGWAAHHGGDSDPRAYEIKVARLTLWCAGVLVGGPVLIATCAAVSGMRRTAVVWTVLAVLLVVPAGRALADGLDTLRPPKPPPSTPMHCQEHSGGDTRCPGG